MAEELDDENASAPSGGSGGTNPAALDAALNGPGASSEEARDFLRRQSKLTDLQAKILHEQHALELSHLRWRRFNDQMKGALQIIVAVLGVSLVVAIAAALWSASEANGVVVDSFSVPPALAQTGLGGDVVAADVTNRLAQMAREMEAHTVGVTRDVRSDSKDEIHIEIPETGVSLTALWRFLRDRLGHERHASGSVREIGDGKIALVVSLTGDDPITVTGDEAYPAGWEQAAAEAPFSDIEPTLFIFYLDDKGRYPEALATARRASEHGLAVRYGLIGNQLPLATGDFARAAAYAHLAMSLAPRVQIFRLNLVDNDHALGRAEEELGAARSVLPLREADQSLIGETRQSYESLRHKAERRVALLTGDYGNKALSCFGACVAGERSAIGAIAAGLMHDTREGERLLAVAAVAADADPDDEAVAEWSVAVAKADWASARAALMKLQDALAAESKGLPLRYRLTVETALATPRLALANAHLGALAEAHGEIDATPRDCYDCVRTRGDIDAIEQRWSGASYWFGEAVRQAPSIPFAYTDWGEMLLHESKYDDAIAKFRDANLKGPHFADPLELWGEALMQENRSDLALKKFEEAARYAPNWGRLHLEWGKALFYVGDTDAAKRQVALARSLDLSASDAAALSDWMKRHG